MKQLTIILALSIAFASCKKQSNTPTPANNTPPSSTSTLTITVNSETITAGQSVVLAASGATTYSWSTGETTSSITVSPTSTTSYTVTGTTGSNTGTATAVVTVSTGTTTANDTIGKVKIFYSLQMNSIAITTGRDYRQDTTNVRIYHNGTQLRNHFVNIGTNGLSTIENGAFTGAHAESPLWCNHGDSIVMVFDSLEINGTTSAQSERFTRITTKIKKYASGISGILINQFDTYQYGNYFGWLEPYYTATTNAWHVLGTKINPTSGLPETWVIGGRFKLVFVIP